MEEIKTTTPSQRKIQNLSALAILLGGLFLGSLLVDLVQLVTGSGFSGRAVKTHNVLQTKDKTWVAYNDPKVSVSVITEKDCERCNPSEPLVWLRRILPTLEAEEVEKSSAIGEALINRFQITSLPAFIFSEGIAQTDFYTQAESLFEKEGGFYYFDMTKIGLPAGKYLKQPEIKAGDSIVGSPEAPVKIFAFSDFQCLLCKDFHANLGKVLKEYEGKVVLIYRNLPLSIHPQAENAALASECANEQGKFQVYADNLFSRQNEWGVTTGTQKFKDYAWQLRLDGRKFTQCLDTKKYQNKVSDDITEAESFGINGTPGMFVNDEFYGGALDYEELKAAIDKALQQ